MRVYEVAFHRHAVVQPALPSVVWHAHGRAQFYLTECGECGISGSDVYDCRLQRQSVGVVGQELVLEVRAESAAVAAVVIIVAYAFKRCYLAAAVCSISTDAEA
jgi:hypothetical protein